MSPEVRFLFALFMTLGLGCWALGNVVAGWAGRRARRQQQQQQRGACICQKGNAA